MPGDVHPTAIVLIGPTAVGKSALVVELAARVGGEIVNADAFQVYAGLDLLSAKPAPELRSRIPHHLIGEVPLTAQFDVGQWRRRAVRIIAEIAARGRVPIVCGGTGLYVRALTHGLAELPPADADWRPAPAEWSARQLVTHLAAAEAPFLERLRRVASDDNPWLPYFGPEVARPDGEVNLHQALANFQAGRERLLAFLSDLALEAWDRPAVHETMGPTYLALQVQNLINHDREHLAEVHKLASLRAERAHA